MCVVEFSTRAMCVEGMKAWHEPLYLHVWVECDYIYIWIKKSLTIFAYLVLIII